MLPQDPVIHISLFEDLTGKFGYLLIMLTLLTTVLYPPPGVPDLWQTCYPPLQFQCTGGVVEWRSGGVMKWSSACYLYLIKPISTNVKLDCCFSFAKPTSGVVWLQIKVEHKNS